MKTIVVSAVNLNEGGTLTILRECLSYLSALALEGEYRIVAMVYDRRLAEYPNIEYMETQWPKQRWINRLWYEYISLKKISKAIGPVYLWLSLHDTTPNVLAERRAVYCHNPFPFYRWKGSDVLLSPKIWLLAIFSKLIYRTNIHKNNWVIVQQHWLREAFQEMFGLPANTLMVAPPRLEARAIPAAIRLPGDAGYRFVYAASPNSHKNFECLCEAAALLEREGLSDFQVYITVNGEENRYARWLQQRWGSRVAALNLVGFLTQEALFDLYAQADCLVFPSKVETWGLPVSEFGTLNKPMLLADLPYAYETAAGLDQVGFFDPESPEALARQMKRLITGDASRLGKVAAQPLDEPFAASWEQLFTKLLAERSTVQE